MLKPAVYHKEYSLTHQILLQREGNIYFSGGMRKNKKTEEMTSEEIKLSKVAKLLPSVTLVV